MTTIVEQYKSLVKKLAHQFRIKNPSQYSDSDLEQEAWIALLKAEKGFDSKRGVKFITYAYTYIYRELLKFIRKQTKIKTVCIEDVKGLEHKRKFEDHSIFDKDMLEFLKNQLTPYEQTIIDGKFKGQSFKEISSVTGIAPVQISKHIEQTVEKLKRAANRELKPHEDD